MTKDAKTSGERTRKRGCFVYTNLLYDGQSDVIIPFQVTLANECGRILFHTYLPQDRLQAWIPSIGPELTLAAFQVGIFVCTRVLRSLVTGDTTPNRGLEQQSQMFAIQHAQHSQKVDGR